MTTETAEWQRMMSTTWLSRGDEVRFLGSVGRGLGGKEGRVQRMLRKNVSVLVDGKTWRVPPSLLKEWRRGDPDNIPQEPEATLQVKQGDATLQAGDVALMHRGGGKFDVVVILDPMADNFRGLRCRMVGKDKTYRYNRSMFVQKLDSEMIVVSS